MLDSPTIGAACVHVGTSAVEIASFASSSNLASRRSVGKSCRYPARRGKVISSAARSSIARTRVERDGSITPAAPAVGMNENGTP